MALENPRAETPSDDGDSDDTDNISVTDSVHSDYGDNQVWELEKIIADAECDELLDDGTVGVQKKYLLKWKGYSIYRSTWETANHLVDGVPETWRAWQETKMRVLRTPGARDFDVEAWEGKVFERYDKRVRRHDRRNKKRERLGLPTVTYAGDHDDNSEVVDTASNDDDHVISDSEDQSSDDQPPLKRLRRATLHDNSEDEIIDASTTKKKRRTAEQMERERAHTRSLLKQKKGVAIPMDKKKQVAKPDTNTAKTRIFSTKATPSVPKSLTSTTNSDQIGAKPFLTPASTTSQMAVFQSLLSRPQQPKNQTPKHGNQTSAPTFSAQTVRPPGAASSPTQPQSAPVARMVGGPSRTSKKPVPIIGRAAAGTTNIFADMDKPIRRRKREFDAGLYKNVSHRYKAQKAALQEAIPDPASLILLDPATGKPIFRNPISRKPGESEATTPYRPSLVKTTSGSTTNINASSEEHEALKEMNKPVNQTLAPKLRRTSQDAVKEVSSGMEVGRPGDYSKACYFYATKGFCKWGSDCPFPHFDPDGPAMSAPEMKAQITCRFWYESGQGCLGSEETCQYSHALKAFISPATPKDAPSKLVPRCPDLPNDRMTCPYWFFGDCMKSEERCRYAHYHCEYIAGRPPDGRRRRTASLLLQPQSVNTNGMTSRPAQISDDSTTAASALTPTANVVTPSVLGQFTTSNSHADVSLPLTAVASHNPETTRTSLAPLVPTATRQSRFDQAVQRDAQSASTTPITPSTTHYSTRPSASHNLNSLTSGKVQPHTQAFAVSNNSNTIQPGLGSTLPMPVLSEDKFQKRPSLVSLHTLSHHITNSIDSNGINNASTSPATLKFWGDKRMEPQLRCDVTLIGLIPSQWRGAEKALEETARKIDIYHICTAESASTFLFPMQHPPLGYGDVVPMSNSKKQLDVLVDHLKAHSAGALYSHPEFSILFFPVKQNTWKAFQPCQPQPEARLHFLFFSPIPTLRSTYVSTLIPPKSVAPPVLESALGLDLGRVFGWTSGEKVEKVAFLMFPPQGQNDMTLVKDYLQSLGVKVYQSGDSGSWHRFVSGHKSGGVVLFHPDFDAYRKIPYLVNNILKKGRFNFFRIALRDTVNAASQTPLGHPETTFILTRLFPHGRAILISDACFSGNPADTLDVVKAIVHRIKSSPISTKLLGRPGLLRWLYELALTEREKQFDSLFLTVDTTRIETYTLLERLLQVDQNNTEGPPATLRPTELSPIFFPLEDDMPGYARIAQVNPKEAENVLATWFADWAQSHIANFRRFIIVHPGDMAKEWGEKYKHIEVLTPHQYLQDAKQQEGSKVSLAKNR